MYSPSSSDPACWLLPHSCCVVECRVDQLTRVTVVVEYITELETGDKLCTSHGGKHGVSEWCDAMMPVVDGQPVDVLMSPSTLVKGQAIGLFVASGFNAAVLHGAGADAVAYTDCVDAVSWLDVQCSCHDAAVRMIVLTISLFILPQRARDKLRQPLHLLPPEFSMTLSPVHCLWLGNRPTHCSWVNRQIRPDRSPLWGFTLSTTGVPALP